MGKYGEGHDFTHGNRVPLWGNKNRKARPRTTPYMASCRLGDEEREAIEYVRDFLLENDDGADWHRDSMTIRRIIKYAKMYVMMLKEQAAEKSAKKIQEAEKLTLERQTAEEKMKILVEAGKGVSGVAKQN